MPKKEPELLKLPDMSPAELAALPVEVLHSLQEQAEAKTKEAARIAAVLHSTLVDRYARGINAPGTSNAEDGAFEVKVTIPKNVEWDQAKLRDAREKIRSEWGEDPTEYIDEKLSVSETKYMSWPNAIRSLFEPARTEKMGKAKIAISKKED